MGVQLIEAVSVPTVNREKEIEEADRRLERMLFDLTVPDSVLFFYGVPTVGKSTVLREIRRRAAGRDVPTALVDFDRSATLNDHIVEDWYDSLAGRVHVAERLMAELSRTGQFTPRLQITPLIAPDQVDEAAERLLIFARELYHFRQRQPFVLFFDTVEDCDLGTFRWLQQEIIAPFLSEFHTLVIIAGRTAPNTSRSDLIYPLERRTLKIPLKPFDDEQTEKQMEAIGAKGLTLGGEELIRYTSGLPGLNDRAVRWLVRQPIEGLRSHLVEEVLFKERLARVTQHIKAELLAVSPLRQFDSGLLRRITDRLFTDKYPVGIGPMRRLLKDLQDTRLVLPHPDGYGYVVPQYLRMPLDGYWQHKQPEEHFLVHQIATQWFKEQVEQADFVAIADRLYHLGGLGRDLRARPELLDRLDSALQPAPADRERLIAELQDTLNRLYELRTDNRAFDLTNKIKRVLSEEEFSIILGSDVAKSLIDTCDRFIADLS